MKAVSVISVMKRCSKRAAGAALGFTASLLLALALSYLWSAVVLVAASVLLACSRPVGPHELYYDK